MIVEVEGHLIDAGKISYISPIGKTDETYSFRIVVGGASILLEFEEERTAEAARWKCAKESGVGCDDWKPKWRPR